MKRLTFAVGILAAAFSMTGVSAAKQLEGPEFADEFGQSLPPIGFVKFCAANPDECRSVGRSSKRISLTPDDWKTLYQVNRAVNAAVKPVSDLELYGEEERWVYPTTAGDCEDYLLLKKRELEKLGFRSGALLITVVLDENGAGHAVLTVATDTGDYILDNRREDIRLWKDTGYTYLKRQSPSDPRRWIALGATRNDGTMVSTGK